MKLCCVTSFCGHTGDFASRLYELAEAGFEYCSWGHQWCTDFLYTAPEITEICRVMKDAGIKILDIHGSKGAEKCWFSPTEYIRLAGVELVRNRIEMLAELGGEGGAVVLHGPNTKFSHESIPPEKTERMTRDALIQIEYAFRTLDELMPVLEKCNVKIAIENLIWDDWGLVDRYLERYPAKRLGICFDAGHANILGNRMNEMEQRKSRLVATHIHDNDGVHDLHKPLFTESIDCEALAKLIATSSYKDQVPCFELSMRNTPYWNEAFEYPWEQSEENRKAFLKDACESCARFGAMIEAAK